MNTPTPAATSTHAHTCRHTEIHVYVECTVALGPRFQLLVHSHTDPIDFPIEFFLESKCHHICMMCVSIS